MPCDSSLARHKLCRGNNCHQDCCVVNTAFSCQPVCNDACSKPCTPIEAYAFIGNNIGTPFILPDVANSGIAGVTGGSASDILLTGIYRIFYENGFFDGCTGAFLPIPTVSVFSSVGTPLIGNLNFFTNTLAIVVITDIDGNPVDGNFTIRAIQNNRDC